MTDTLAAEYPEAAPYIQRAVDEHGEAWVLENYYKKIYPLKRVMAVPEKEELPFYDADEHDTITEAEQVEVYQAWAEYRENLRTGTKPGEWLVDACGFEGDIVECYITDPVLMEMFKGVGASSEAHH